MKKKTPTKPNGVSDGLVRLEAMRLATGIAATAEDVAFTVARANAFYKFLLGKDQA